jgi:hypothetical protein
VQWQSISNEKDSGDEQVQENCLNENVAQSGSMGSLSDIAQQLNRLPNQET